MKIKLTKKFCKTNGSFTESPDHLSNGHWAINRSLIANPEDFVSPEAIATYLGLGPYDVKTIDQPKMDGVFPKKTNDDPKVIKLTFNGRIENTSDDLSSAMDYCLFERIIGEVHKSDKFVKFNRNYIEHLRLAKETLYGDKLDGAFRNADGSIVVMPIRS